MRLFSSLQSVCLLLIFFALFLGISAENGTVTTTTSHHVPTSTSNASSVSTTEEEGRSSVIVLVVVAVSVIVAIALLYVAWYYCYIKPNGIDISGYYYSPLYHVWFKVPSKNSQASSSKD